MGLLPAIRVPYNAGSGAGYFAIRWAYRVCVAVFANSRDGEGRRCGEDIRKVPRKGDGLRRRDFEKGDGGLWWLSDGEEPSGGGRRDGRRIPRTTGCG